jgi:hypothetical protein
VTYAGRLCKSNGCTRLAQHGLDSSGSSIIQPANFLSNSMCDCRVKAVQCLASRGLVHRVTDSPQHLLPCLGCLFCLPILGGCSLRGHRKFLSTGKSEHHEFFDMDTFVFRYGIRGTLRQPRCREPLARGCTFLRGR